MRRPSRRCAPAPDSCRRTRSSSRSRRSSCGEACSARATTARRARSSRGVLEVDERDVVAAGDDAASCDRRDRDGVLVEPVAQDREVMRAEVPDDADVVLVQAEVDAAHRDEMRGPDRRPVGSARGSGSRSGCRGTCARGRWSAPGRVRCRRGEPPRPQSPRGASRRTRACRPRGPAAPAGNACRPVSRSPLPRASRPRAAPRSRPPAQSGITAGQLRPRALVAVADRNELGLRQLLEIACEVRPPVAEADHGDANRLDERAVAVHQAVHQMARSRRKTCVVVRSRSERSRRNDQARA